MGFTKRQAALALGLVMFLPVAVAVPARAERRAQTTPPPSVVLQDPGDEPREPLRWIIPPVGTTRTITIGFEVTLGGSMLGPAPISTQMTMTVESTIRGPGVQGSTTVASRVVDATVVDDAAATQVLRQSYVGWGYETDVTAEGRVLETRRQALTAFDPSTSASLSQLQSQLQGMTKPFPTDPLGLGARWRVTEKAESSGIPITNRTEYRLVRRDGDAVELAMTVVQKAKRGPAEFPGVPAGTTVRIRDWSGSGRGNQVLSLSQPFDPITADSAMTSRQRFHLRRGSQTQNMSLTMDLELSITS